MVYLRSILGLVVSIIFLFPTLSISREKTLTLSEAITRVLASNPTIQAAHYRREASKAKIPQAKSLDDPKIGVEFFNVPINTINIGRSDDVDYMIQQDIPFPGKLRTKGKVAKYNAAAVSSQMDGAVSDVLLDLKRTYYDLYRLNRQLEVNRQNQNLFRQLLSSASSNYAGGKTTANYSLQTQVELSKLKNEEIIFKQEKITHEAHLKALLNQPTHESIQIPRQLKWPKLNRSLKETIQLALESRPELAQLDAMEQRDRASVTVAKQTFIPDFSFQFAYKNKTGGRQDVWSGTTTINLPIFWKKKNGKIDEARASLKATQAEQESMAIHTHHEIEQAYTAVKAAKEILSSYQTGILPQAKTTLEIAHVSYASGDTDFLTLIDAARSYRDLQMSYYFNQALLGIRFAELERLVGKDLDSSGGTY